MDKICLIMKTFLRDGYMMESVNSIMKNYPEIKIILVDDGKEDENKNEFYTLMENKGHVVVKLPFDSGFGAKANAALYYCDREYVLHANDDFIFVPDIGIEHFINILDMEDEIGIVGGRISNLPYEGFLEISDGYIKETFLDLTDTYNKLYKIGESKFALCDITSVFFLARRKIFENVKWDASYKIGGEHGDLFMDIKKAGWEIAFCPDANINQFTQTDGVDPEYKNYRGRDGWRPLFKKKHNITKYIGFYATDNF